MCARTRGPEQIHRYIKAESLLLKKKFSANKLDTEKRLCLQLDTSPQLDQHLRKIGQNSYHLKKIIMSEVAVNTSHIVS